MYDLSKFSFVEVLDVGAKLRKIAAGLSSMEAAAQRVALFFYNNFDDTSTGQSYIVLALLQDAFLWAAAGRFAGCCAGVIQWRT